MFKKGQAAMEFLMTYGWAILVVLAAIGALAYFGVLSPDRFLPEKCTLPAGIACLDFRYTGTAVEMSIQNGAGFDMSGVSVTVNGTGCNAMDNTSSATLTNGQTVTYSVTCSPSSGKFKGDVTFAYTNQQTGMAHSKMGEIIVKIP
ncbi:hypothetical protein KY345_03165 [Candidatus Woesearchaeota archaeon]|nr:hypothetical protein [Candidatus Woesearchaeota archaeon]